VVTLLTALFLIVCKAVIDHTLEEANALGESFWNEAITGQKNSSQENENKD